MKFIHISDLHYHQNPDDNSPTDALLGILGTDFPDHHLIVTGDITDDGHLLQYENALTALKPFIGRISIAPGNHDFGATGLFYSEERARRFDEMLSIPLQQGGTFSGDTTPVITVVGAESNRVMLIALDTNLETPHPFDFSCGEVGEGQLRYLSTVLSNPQNARMCKIVFFHHHPFIHNDPSLELKDGRTLMRMLYGRVDAILFGHKHVMGKWEKVNGTQVVLASDNSPGKDWVRELIVENGAITVNNLSVKPKTHTRKRGGGKG
jgi:3',5'-cyclic AMP phosphodiesterase CpdA